MLFSDDRQIHFLQGRDLLYFTRDPLPVCIMRHVLHRSFVGCQGRCGTDPRDTLGKNAPRRLPEIGVARNAPSVQQYDCPTEIPIVLDPVLPKRRRLRHRLNLPLAPQRLTRVAWRA